MSAEILTVVSDTHCGSVQGLATPETETEHGNVIGFGNNIHQAWLWDSWGKATALAAEIIGASEAVLAVNGDATENAHHRNNAELIAQDIDTHTNIAIACLRPLAALCKVVVVTKGTECHTLNMENKLAEKLDAVGGKARDEWLFEMCGCLVDVKHHMCVTARANLEASGMGIYMNNARLNRARSGHRMPKIFLRGHRHCGGWFSDGNGLFGVTGGWQVLTRHGNKVVTDSLPSPTMLILDWRGRKLGSIPQVHEIKFNLPQPDVTSF